MMETVGGSSGHSVGASYFRPGLRGEVTYENIAVSDCAAAGLKVLYKAADSPQLTLRNVSLANVGWADRVVPDPTPGPDPYRVTSPAVLQVSLSRPWPSYSETVCACRWSISDWACDVRRGAAPQCLRLLGRLPDAGW